METRLAFPYTGVDLVSMRDVVLLWLEAQVEVGQNGLY